MATRKDLKQHDLVKQLRPDPKVRSDCVELSGFLGESVRKGYWRIYSDTDLDFYVEVAEDDILTTEPASRDDPNAETRVWLREGCDVEYTFAAPLQSQGEFLEGPITEDLLKRLGAGDTYQPQALLGITKSLIHVATRFVCTKATMCTRWCCPNTGATACATCLICRK